MDTWWWLALGAVVALSLVAALVDGGARLGPRRRRRAPLPDRGPRPGEIWWTREPLLVLVLTVRMDGARAVRVTAEAPGDVNTGGDAGGEAGGGGKEDGEGRLPLPPGTVAGAAGRVSTLQTGTVLEVALSDFRHRAGHVDQDTWDRLRHLTGEE